MRLIHHCLLRSFSHHVDDPIVLGDSDLTDSEIDDDDNDDVFSGVRVEPENTLHADLGSSIDPDLVTMPPHRDECDEAVTRRLRSASTEQKTMVSNHLLPCRDVPGCSSHPL
jgi:hypothetical protein